MGPWRKFNIVGENDKRKKEKRKRRRRRRRESGSGSVTFGGMCT